MGSIDLPKNYLALIQLELRDLTNYQETVEQYFKKNANNISSQMDRLRTEPFDKRKTPQEYIDSLLDDYRSFEVQFPNHFRASFLSQMCSLFETHLKRLCLLHYELINPDYDSPKMRSFLKKDNIHSYGEYFKELPDLDFDKVKSDFEFLVIVYRIRNVFTHHSGRLIKPESEEIVNDSKKKVKVVKNHFEEIDKFADKYFMQIEKRYSFKRVNQKIIYDRSNYVLLLKQDFNIVVLAVIRSFFTKLLSDNLRLKCPENSMKLH